MYVHRENLYPEMRLPGCFDEDSYVAHLLRRERFAVDRRK